MKKLLKKKLQLLFKNDKKTIYVKNPVHLDNSKKIPIKHNYLYIPF